MDRFSLQEAKERSKLASDRLDELERANPNIGNDVIRAWEGFVSELNRSFNKLMHGEKKGGAASVVTAKIRVDRKSDPLLAYLRAARNSLEHGLGHSGTVGGKARPLAAHEGVPMVSFNIKLDDGSENVTHFTRDNTMVIDQLKPVLVPVTIEGKRYDPPESHLGKPIIVPSPLCVGRIAISYLEQRILELESLT